MAVLSSVISTPKLIINSSDTIYEALDKMLERELSTCPVVDSQGKFLGQITDAIFIKALILLRSGQNIKHIYELREHFTIPPTISSITSIDEIASKIFLSPSQRVFVVDSTDKLLGLVSPKNVLKFLAMEFGYIDSVHEPESVSSERQMAAELKSIQSRLENALDRKEAFEKALGNSSHLVIILDSKLNSFYINKKAVATLGLAPDSCENIKAKNLLTEQSFQELEKLFQQCQHQKADLHINTYLSFQTPGLQENRTEVSVSIDPETDGLTSLIGKNIDADQLLRKLNGVYT